MNWDFRLPLGGPILDYQGVKAEDVVLDINIQFWVLSLDHQRLTNFRNVRHVFELVQVVPLDIILSDLLSSCVGCVQYLGSGVANAMLV